MLSLANYSWLYLILFFKGYTHTLNWVFSIVTQWFNFKNHCYILKCLQQILMLCSAKAF